MQSQFSFKKSITVFLAAVFFTLMAFPSTSGIGQTAVLRPPLQFGNDYLIENEIRQHVKLHKLPELSQSVMASKFVRQGSQDKKRISITFDDGPYLMTEKYIKVLQEYDIQATFFLIGVQIEKYPDEAKKIVEGGYEIGVHSYAHRNLSAMNLSSIEADFEKSLAAVKKITDSNIRFFRPPFGAFNDSVIGVAKKHNLATILWCVDPRDWQENNPDLVAQHVLDHAVNGAIILLHEGRESTVNALPKIIEGLWAQGYEIVPLSELLSEEIS